MTNTRTRSRSYGSLVGKKHALDSKGFLGGVGGLFSAGLLAWIISAATPLKITAADVTPFLDAWPAIMTSGQDLWELLSLSGVALVSALVGLAGNWGRQVKVAWSGVVQKRPWKSRGVLGGVVTFVSASLVAVKTFLMAVSTDGPQVLDWIDQAQGFVINLEHTLMLGAAAVVTATSGLLMAWGRWRADARIAPEVGEGSE